MSASTFQHVSAWLFAFACASTAFVSPGSATPAPSVVENAQTAGEPFGLITQAMPDGPLWTKWRAVERNIESELKIIADCRSNRANCTSPPALQFLQIVDIASSQTGLARIGEINRAFNLAIRPMSDQAQYGVEDIWTSPLATLAAGAGDCEDYAIAKLVALREAGIAPSDLRLVILRDLVSREDHAVVAARVEGHWRMLDNRYFLLLEDSDLSKVEPIFAIDDGVAKRFAPLELLVAKNATGQQPFGAAESVTDADLTTSAIGAGAASVAGVDFWQTHAM